MKNKLNNEISGAFATFYKKLYSNTDTCTEFEQIDAYLESINLPKLSEEDSQAIDRTIMREEIIETIKGLKNGKSPGSDGYCNEFYKAFVDDISPILEKAYAYAFERGEFPPNWKETIILVIHKEGKDPTECSSYRPIALQNSDCKILTSILAKRLKTVITTLVHQDQTGFITGRQLSDNIRRLLNVMSYAKSKPVPCMALALDAEKAFDHVSWPFLFSVLRKYGLGPGFIKWVQQLCSSPKASVWVNVCFSQKILLGRGCRQGDPLSPLLFALSIEPLAQLIRDSTDISGIEVSGEEHRLSLYADDVIVYCISQIPQSLFQI
uniref:Reverse transcriptase domain-containing protein n=1 Tax=Cyprinus carpio TaxID=7962 RepID=A0A8C1BL18_CYPCA